MTTTFKEGTNGFYCAECRMSFAEPLEICPYCGSEKTWLLKGNELNIKEIEVI